MRQTPGQNEQVEEFVGPEDLRPEHWPVQQVEHGAKLITDPVVVVEVLSPSTMDFDRGKKLQFYKDRASIRHIVLAYSDQMRVEHYVRGANGWDFRALTRPEDELSLDAVEYKTSLENVYFDLPF